MDRYKILSDILKAVSTIAVIAMVLISLFVYKASLQGLLLFAVFIAFFVYLPGLFIVRLLGIRAPHLSSRLLISFFAGWALLVAEYFLNAAAGLPAAIYAAGPLCSAACVALIIKDKGLRGLVPDTRPSKLPASLFLFIALIMLYVFLNTQFQYYAPEYCSSVTGSNDKVYQMGLIYSLTHGYPLADPYVAGKIVHYHIFTQVMLAAAVKILGLTPDFLVMSCCPYLTVCLFGLSVYAMFRHFCRRGDRAGLYSLSVVFAHQLVARSISASYLFRMMLINENYGGFALASAIAWLIALDIYCEADSPSHREHLCHTALLLMLIMLTTGIKAPVGMVMAGGLIGTLLLGLILRRRSARRMLLPAAVSAAGFFAVYRLLLTGGGTSGVGGDSIIGFGEITGVCFWKPALVSALKAAGLPEILRLAIVLAVFSLAFFTIYLLPFIIGYVRELVLVIRGDKDYRAARVTVYAAAFVGYFLMFLLRYDGHSQVYFGTVAAIFAPLIAFWFLEDVDRDSAKWMQKLKSISLAVCCITLIFTTVTLAGEYASVMPKAVRHASPKARFDKYKSLSADEYAAMQWLRENTDADDLIATQMYASVNYDKYDVEDRWKSCHFVYAAYSGRYYYLEGSGYTFTFDETEERAEMVRNTNRLYEPENSGRAELAKSLGIDYVMVTEKLYPAGDLSGVGYTKVFSNKDITIYRVD